MACNHIIKCAVTDEERARVTKDWRHLPAVMMAMLTGPCNNHDLEDYVIPDLTPLTRLDDYGVNEHGE